MSCLPKSHHSYIHCAVLLFIRVVIYALVGGFVEWGMLLAVDFQLREMPVPLYLFREILIKLLLEVRAFFDVESLADISDHMLLLLLDLLSGTVHYLRQILHQLLVIAQILL